MPNFTDLKTWSADNRWVYSVANPFSAADTGSWIRVFSGTGFLSGYYLVGGTASTNVGPDGTQTVAFLGEPSGPAGATAGVGGTVVPLNRAVAVGDSITQGLDDGTPPLTAWPVQLGRLLGPTWRVYNTGVSGRTLLDMTAAAATEVDPLFDTTTNTARQMVLLFGGTNDIFFGADAPTTFARYQAYCQARRAAHPWEIISFPILNRNQPTAPAGMEAYRTQFNGLLLAGYTAISDGIVRSDVNPRLGLPTSSNNPAFFYYGTSPDQGVHLTGAGQNVLARDVYNATVASNDLAGVGLTPGSPAKGYNGQL